jgi:hypothetical protein
MSLSDCPECWDTPCACGWEYKHYGIKELKRMRNLFDALIDYKILYENHLPPEKFHDYINQHMKEKT